MIEQVGELKVLAFVISGLICLAVGALAATTFWILVADTQGDLSEFTREHQKRAE
jgi:hypothetical protein